MRFYVSWLKLRESLVAQFREYMYSQADFIALVGGRPYRRTNALEPFPGKSRKREPVGS